jgi:hypothetical protein
VTKKKPVEQTAEQQAAVELVRLANERGLSLIGPDGLLKQLTKTVLHEEMTSTLGYEKHDPAGAGSGNRAHGVRSHCWLTADVEHQSAAPTRRAGHATAATVASMYPVVGEPGRKAAVQAIRSTASCAGPRQSVQGRPKLQSWCVVTVGSFLDCSRMSARRR